MTVLSAFSQEELRALALAFPDSASVRGLLGSVGYPLEHLPVWNATSAAEVWYEIAERLALGVIPNGRARVLAAAAARFPGVSVFGEQVVLRLAPSWDVLQAARPLPEHYVPRVADLDALHATLSSHGAGHVGVIGMGGAGKSTLARAAVHDDVLRARFADGVVWVDVGPDADTAEVQARVLRAFGDLRPVLAVADGRERLRDLLAGAYCLVVLDDVWEAAVVDAFPRVAGVRYLITARTHHVLPTGAERLRVGRVDAKIARELLAAYARWPAEGLPSRAETVLSYCDGLALALAIAGGLISEHWGWDEIADRFSEADLDALRARFPDYPNGSLLVVLGTTIDILPTATASRFHELAVFRGRGRVSSAVLTELWAETAGLGRAQTLQALRDLANVSLISLDLLTDTVSVHGLVIDYARARLGSSRFAELHGLLAARLLRRWGSVDEGLPDLVKLVEPTEVDRYTLSALVDHLLAAGDPDTVDRLLGAEQPSAARHKENIWHAMHEDWASIESYLATVRAAWRDAQEQAQAGDRAMFAREATYALLVGSMTSRAGNVPASLLVRLAEAALWSATRVISYAQANRWPDTRASALARLAPHVPAEQRPQIFQRAVAALEAIDEPDLRADVLAGLASVLPADDLERVATRTLVDMTTMSPAHRAAVLASLAPFLRPDTLDETLRQLLGEVTALETPESRAVALADLASLFPADERGHLLDQALDDLAAMNAPGPRAEALTELGPLLPPDLVNEALDILLALDSPFDRALPLAELAPYAVGDQLARLLAQVLDDIPDLDSESIRLDILTKVAPRLPDTLARPILEQVLAELAASPWMADTLFADLAPQLPEDLVPKAFNVAEFIDAPEVRAQALAALAPYLPDNLILDALDTATKIDEPDDRAVALEGLAPHLPADALDWAADAALTIDSATDVLLTWTALAAYLPDGYAGDLIDLASVSDLSEHGLADALAGAVPHLPEQLLGEVVDAALNIDEPYPRARLLTLVLPDLDSGSHDEILEQILEDAHGGDLRPDQVAEIMTIVAPCLPSDEQQPILAQTLSDVLRIGSASRRASALAMLIPSLHEENDLSIAREALSHIITAPDSITRLDPKALKVLAPFLRAEAPEYAMTRALEAAIDTDWEEGRAYALASLAPCLPDHLVTRASDAASAITSPEARAIALAGVAPHLPPDQRHTVLTRALQAGSTVSRSSVIQVITSVLGGNRVAAEPDGHAAVAALLRVQEWWP
ncbi:putative NB-ARC domain protein [Frankia canadensis]|uniref:Putative NB-ARC domain protein n=1 Tax=Frankia canadensis TaxID=1836972 RepID=A0A2I2L2V3_9ACTN|nr:NB-ARC domain-containing protein [Frankia canadensis]SNQ52197.1 putative NB-ARC domain protein [Frankia canadensis]SOU59487.1 putative NB-ARC domain protein [Frankia canadensis]